MLRGMTQPQRPEVCPACGRYPDVARFCLRCGVLNSHPLSGDRAAPYLYRLAAELLDLLIFALGIAPWLIWMWYTARDGQSPAKRLLGMYVIAEDGQPISPQRMWMRELGIKRLLFGLLGYLFSGLPTLIDGGWMLLNPDRQCVHDRMVGTLVVVHREPFAAPRGPAPRPDLSGCRAAAAGAAGRVAARAPAASRSRSGPGAGRPGPAAGAAGARAAARGAVAVRVRATAGGSGAAAAGGGRDAAGRLGQLFAGA